MRLLFDQYVRVVTEYPKIVLFIIALISVGLALGLPRFKLDASADSLTLEHDEDLRYFREVSKEYGSGEFLVITYRPEVDLFSDASLDTLGELKHDLSKIHGIQSINSILDVPLLYSPKQNIADVIANPRTLLTPGVDRAMAKKEFQNSPIYRKLILGEDGQTTAMQLNIEVDETYIDLVQARDALRKKAYEEGLTESEEKELTKVSQEFLEYRTQSEARSRQRVEDIRNVVAQYQDRAEIFVGGVSMITADMISFIRSDLVVFGVAVLLFMVVILAVIFRRFRYVAIPMAVCLTAVLMMLGYVSWLDWRLTVISSNFVALLLIISLAIIIHLVVRYREYAQENPDWSQKELVAATVRFMARPCLYTALTTIVAFASLVVSDIRPVIDFGWMMTIGLVVALSLAFLLMPAWLVLLPREEAVPKEVKEKEHKPLTLVFSRIVENRGPLVLVGSVVIAVLSGIGISQLKVENRFIDYFHESTEIYQGLKVIDQQLGGTTSLDIILSRPEEALATAEEEEQFGNVDDPYGEDPFDTPGSGYDDYAEDDAYGDDAYGEDGYGEEAFGDDGFGEDEETERNYWVTVSGLKKIEAVHDYLDSLPQIGKVQSLAILYKVGKDLNNGLNDFELAVMQRTLSGGVKDVLLSPYTSKDSGETRITMRIHDTYPDLNRKELVENIRTHLQTEFGYTSDTMKISGLLVLYNNMLQSLFSSQIVTLGVVFLGIMIMFVVLFRSFTIAVVAIVPNMLAALSILGAMGLMGLPLDMMTITIAAITVGIGVDDTIHYIHRFKEEFKKDGDYLATMHRAHASIGRAMYYTSVIIVFGFSIMVLSRFIPTIYFGLLTGLAMFAALMGAMLLLPKLILMLKPFSKPELEKELEAVTD